MPLKDLEARRAYQKAYGQKKKAELQAYRDANKEKKRLYDQSEKKKAYHKSPAGRKSHRLDTWRSRGVVSDDWDALYEKYLTTTHCELCQVELTTGKRCKTMKFLDHCHASGAFRNVACMSCNSSLPQQPRNAAGQCHTSVGTDSSC